MTNPLPPHIDDILRKWMWAALILSVIAIILLLSSCRQMPVLRGQYQEDRVEQAKTAIGGAMYQFRYVTGSTSVTAYLQNMYVEQSVSPVFLVIGAKP